MAEDEDRQPEPAKRDWRRKLPDRDTLYQLYVVEGLTVRDISRRYRTSRQGVRRALRRAELRQPRPRRLMTDEEVATIKRLFDAGMRHADIAVQVGRSSSAVSKVVQRYRWTRPRLRRRRKREGG